MADRAKASSLAKWVQIPWTDQLIQALGCCRGSNPHGSNYSGEPFSGKSSLLSLLGGIYQPTKGRVSIGGIDLMNIADDIGRRNIAYISPRSKLFHGTIYENLTLFEQHTNVDEIMHLLPKDLVRPRVIKSTVSDIPVFQQGVSSF